jgi:hypothetical protein
MGHSLVGSVLVARLRYYVYAVHNKLSEEMYTVHKAP